MEIKRQIAVRIKTLREAKKLTQEKLAWNSDVDRTFMNHVENAKRNISIGSLEKILNGLEISFKDFFSDDSFGPPKKKRK